MSGLQQHSVKTAYLSGTTAIVGVGYVLIPDVAPNDQFFVIATTANLSATGRTQSGAGLSITAGDATNRSVEIQTVGPIPPSISGLGAGAAGDIRVGATGRLERGTAAPGQLSAGKCDADGWAYLGFMTGSVTGAAPGSPDRSMQYRASDTTFGGSSSVGVSDDADRNLEVGTSTSGVPTRGDIRFRDPEFLVTTRTTAGAEKVLAHVYDPDPSTLPGGLAFLGRDPVPDVDGNATNSYYGLFAYGGVTTGWGLNRFYTAAGETHRVDMSYSAGPGTAESGADLTPNITDSRATFVFSRYVNVAFMGAVTKEYVTQGETLSRGDGVISIGQAGINPDPSFPPDRCVVAYCNASSSNDMFYLRPDGTTVPMFGRVANVGTGDAGVYRDQSANGTLNFRRLVEGSNVTITENADTIEIAASTGGSGEANTSSNSGSGAGLAQAKVGVDLPFKSIIGTSPVFVTANTDDLTLSLNGGTDGQFLGYNSSSAVTWHNRATFYTVGTTGNAATVGGLRVTSAAQAIVAGRNASNANDIHHLTRDGSDNTYVGTNAAFTSANQSPTTNVFARTTLDQGVGALTYVRQSAGLFQSSVPRVGFSSPFSSDGYVNITSYKTLVAGEYSRTMIDMTPGISTTGTMTFPHPASDDASYFKLIRGQSSAASITLSTGTGTTVGLGGVTDWTMYIFTPAGVSQGPTAV